MLMSVAMPINLVPRAFPFLSLGRREKALAPGGLLCIHPRPQAQARAALTVALGQAVEQN